MESLQGSFFLSISLQQRKKTTKQTINHCRLFSCFFRVDISSSLYAPSFQKYLIFFYFTWILFLSFWLVEHTERKFPFINVVAAVSCVETAANSGFLLLLHLSAFIIIHRRKTNKSISWLLCLCV